MTHIAPRVRRGMTALVRISTRCGLSRATNPTLKIAMSGRKVGKEPCPVCLESWRKERGTSCAG